MREIRDTIACLAVTLAVASPALAAEPGAAPTIAERLPAALLRATLDGQAVRFSSRLVGQGGKGKALVLSFYWTRCVACNEELPEIEALAERPGVELYVVALLLDKNASTGRCGGMKALRETFASSPLKKRVVYDECGRMAQELLGQADESMALPVTMLVGPDLRVAKTLVGRPAKGTVAEALESELGKLLGK